MSAALGAALLRHGREVVLFSYEGGSFVEKGRSRAFIQPIARRDRQYYSDTRTELGIEDSGKYLYLGPRSFDISPSKDGFLLCGGEKYSLVREEKFDFAGMSHVWAILKKTEEEYDA